MPLQQQDPDELWSMRNQYYVGNYEGVFSEAESAHVDANSRLFDEKELFIQLARLAQGEPEIDPVAAAQHSGVEFKALALLFKLNAAGDDNDAQKQQLVAELKRLVDEDGAKNARLRIIAASAVLKHTQAGENDALRMLFPVKRDLEVMHLETYIYLSMDRVDLAATKVEDMKQVDEDSTLCQLSLALVGLHLHQESEVQECVEVLRELTSKWVPTALLASALSSALICQSRFQDALDAVQEVPEDERTAELLLNSICAAQHLGARLDEYIGGLKQIDPSNAWFADMAQSSASFDQAAAKFLQE